MSAIVWIIAENKQLAAELVGGAREIGGADAQIPAFVGGDEGAAGELIAMGADSAYAMPIAADALWESYASELAKRAEEVKPALIMVGATKRGRDMAAQLAGRMDAPCVSDAKSIAFDNGTIEATRMVFGGLAVKTVSTSVATVIATVAAQCYEPLAIDASRSGDVQTLQPAVGPKVIASPGRRAP